MGQHLDIRDLAEVVGFRVVYKSDSRGWGFAILTGIQSDELGEIDLAYISFPDPIDGQSGDWIPIDQITPFLRPLARIRPEDALVIIRMAAGPQRPALIEEGTVSITPYEGGADAPNAGIRMTFSSPANKPIELDMRYDLAMKWRHEQEYIAPYNMVAIVDFLSRKGYDVRGWIEKGLALDVTQPGEDTVPNR